jgi:DNA replication initiation complex subunit (GINS family)
MISYNELYEVLRKEKFSESLQQLPKNFLDDVSQYLVEKKNESDGEDMFSENANKMKKQLENSIALFREIVMRRKKKLLNLVFVAAETGIMKRDYENMLSFEKEMFDKLVKAFEESEREINQAIRGKKSEKDINKMIIFTQDIEQFVDMNGKILGPFNSGQLANLDSGVVELFVSAGKARYVDEFN